jgi:hypothetical protein
MSERFPYLVDRRFAPLWVPFGFRPAKDAVTITDDRRLVATYGFFRVDTLLANVDGAHITTGYRWWTAVGARMSFVDTGLTFGTNASGGVCIHFREPVGGVGRPSHWSALTVTVADLPGLVRALEGLGPVRGA